MSAPELHPAVALLADAALKGSLLLVAALAATTLMRRASAAARHFVWLAALAGVVALPVAGALMPAWEVLPFADPFAAPVLSDAVAPPAVTPQPSLPAATPPADAVTPAPVAGEVAARTPEVPPAALSLSPAATEGAWFGAELGWMGWLAAAWAAGVAFSVLRLGYGVARVWWLERAAREITDDGWIHLADGLARRLRLGRMVTLLRAGEAQVPMTWGVLRPVVLLPDTADGWDDGRRTVVLAHELAHVRRWDALTQWVAHVALALFWFNPLVWMASRKLREEREHACDDAVLAIGARPADYADHLLSLVRSLGRAEGPVAALAMARRSQFEGRLLAILDGATPRGGLSRGLGIATLMAAAALIAPLAALRGAIPAGAPAPASPAAEAPALAGAAAETPAARTSSAGETASGATAAVTEAAAERRVAAAVEAGLRGPLPSTVAAQASTDPTLAAIVKSLPSDEKRASVLVGQVDGAQAGPGDYAAIIRAAEGIRSPEERMRVLSSVLEQPDATASDGALVLAATHTMGSATYQRLVIARAVERGWLRDAGFRAAFSRAVGHVDSPTDRRLVLSSALEGAPLDEATLRALLGTVPGMAASSQDQRLVLVAAAESQRITGPVRDAYLAAAASIRSEGERSLALAALASARSRDAAPRPSRSSAPPAEARPSASTRTSAAGAARGESLWSATTETDVRRDGRPYHVRVVASQVVGGWDGTPVRTIRPGGSLLVEETCDSEHHLLRMLPRADGTLDVTYTVNGEPRPFDRAAEQWMHRAIRDGSGRR